MGHPDHIDLLIRPLATDLVQAAHLHDERQRELAVLGLLRGAVRAIIHSTIEEARRALAASQPVALDPQRAVDAALEPVLEAVQRERNRDPLALALLQTVVMNTGRLTGQMVARYIDDVCAARAALAKNFQDYIALNGKPAIVMTRIPMSEGEVMRAYERFCDARRHVLGVNPDAEHHAFRSAMISLMQETPTLPAAEWEVRQ